MSILIKKVVLPCIMIVALSSFCQMAEAQLFRGRLLGRGQSSQMQPAQNYAPGNGYQNYQLYDAQGFSYGYNQPLETQSMISPQGYLQPELTPMQQSIDAMAIQSFDQNTYQPMDPMTMHQPMDPMQPLSDSLVPGLAPLQSAFVPAQFNAPPFQSGVPAQPAVNFPANSAGMNSNEQTMPGAIQTASYNQANLHPTQQTVSSPNLPTEGIRLTYDSKEAVPVKFTINKSPMKLEPGGSMLMKAGETWEFAAGGTEGLEPLVGIFKTPGNFLLKRTETGFEMIQTEDAMKSTEEPVTQTEVRQTDDAPSIAPGDVIGDSQ